MSYTRIATERTNRHIVPSSLLRKLYISHCQGLRQWLDLNPRCSECNVVVDYLYLRDRSSSTRDDDDLVNLKIAIDGKLEYVIIIWEKTTATRRGPEKVVVAPPCVLVNIKSTGIVLITLVSYQNEFYIHRPIDGDISIKWCKLLRQLRRDGRLEASAYLFAREYLRCQLTNRKTSFIYQISEWIPYRSLGLSIVGVSYSRLVQSTSGGSTVMLNRGTGISR